MTDNYNTPHRDEILAPIIDTNGQPQIVYNVKKIADGTTLWENVYFELVNQIIQNGTWATANVINNIIGKTNAQTELITTLMLLADLKDNIRSTGNDNLEVFGISDAARIGILNNHSDFMITSASASIGSDEIQVLNSLGFRYFKSHPVETNQKRTDDEGYTLNLNYFTGELIRYYNAVGADRSKITKINVENNSVSTLIGDGTNQGAYYSKSYGKNGVMYGGSTGLSSNTKRVLRGSGYPDISGTYNYEFGLIKNNTMYQLYGDSITKKDLNLNPQEDVNLGTYTRPEDVYSIVDSLICDDDKWIIMYITTNNTMHLMTGSETNRNFTKIFSFPSTNSIRRFFEIDNLLFFAISSKTATHWSRFDAFLAEKIYTMRNNAIGGLVEMTSINSYLRGRLISDMLYVEETDTIWVTGTDNLCLFSTDRGLSWNEFETTLNDDFLGVAFNPEKNELYLGGNSNIHIFESYNVDAANKKRYVFENELITIDSIVHNGATSTLKLKKPLVNSHTTASKIQRTMVFRVEPNSTRYVCVELENIYTHNAAVAIPIFTSLENVTVTAEICQRNNETEIEEWVPFPLINSLDVRGWKKNTYFKVFEQAKQVTAIAFTVVNNNDSAVELHQLNIGLSDEIYELGGE